MRPAALIALMVLALLASPPSAAQTSVASTNEYLARMDSNRDGRVSLEEYLAWMLQSFDAMDRNRDGVLDASEHPGAARRVIRREDYRDNLIAAFRRQDSNGDGYLDARELAAPPR